MFKHICQTGAVIALVFVLFDLHGGLCEGFIENQGQISDENQSPRNDVSYYYQNQNFSFYLSDQGMHYSFSVPNKEDSSKIDIERVDVLFAGANEDFQILTSQLIAYHNFYTTQFAENGLLQVPSFKVLYLRDVYPDIDLRFTVQDSSVKYDIIIGKNGSLSDLHFQYNTFGNTIDLEGNELVLFSDDWRLSEFIPVSYIFDEKSDTQYVDVSYILKKNGIVQLQTEADLSGKVLVVDPVLNWATYYGGSGSESGRGLHIDNRDNIYICGQTSSSFGIATAGAHRTTMSGNSNAFVAKFDPKGNRLWGTYYGGSRNERGDGVAVDANNNVYVTGRTRSSDGIVTSGAYQTSLGGVQDAFLVKFNHNGIRQWGTYYGGNSEDRGNSVAYDYNGNIVMAGHARSTSGIASPGAHQTVFGGGVADMFIAKFDTSGNREWATYYGGSGYDDARDVAADINGNIYVGGRAISSSLATADAHQVSPGSGDNGILVKFAPTGVPEWATYYGGNGTDRGRGVAVDHNQNVYLTGITSSRSGIATTEANQTTIGGSDDGFLVKFNSSGTRQWGTYIGGGQFDETFGVVADSCENVYVTGTSASTNNIAMGDVHQSTLAGTRDAILLRFNSSGQQEWGTYFGGPGEETGWYTGLKSNNEVVIGGWTNSSNEIATPGAHQVNFGGNQDAFVANFQCMKVDIEVLQGDTSGCPGDTILIGIDNSDLLSSINWYKDGQLITGTESPTLSIIENGTYKANVKYTSCCQFFTSEIEISFSNDKAPVLTLPKDTTIVFSDTFQINADVTGGTPPYTFNWSTPLVLSNHTVLRPFASPLQSTTFKLEVTDNEGCKSIDSFTVTVLNEQGDTIHTSVPISPNVLYATVIETNTAIEVVWDYSENRTLSQFILYRSEIGTYQMKEIAVIDDNQESSFIDVKNTEISNVFCYAIRAVDLHGNLSKKSNPGCIIVPTGNSETLTNYISWNPYFQWDSSVELYVVYKSEDEEPYTQVGQTDGDVLSFTDSALGDNRSKYCYRIKAIESNGNGESFSTELCLRQPAHVFIPNAFSPFGSPGLNDTFGPKGMFINDYNMQIFSHWGQIVYETNNSKPWNGSIGNEQAIEGVYLYRITLTGYNGEVEFFTGTLTLIK